MQHSKGCLLFARRSAASAALLLLLTVTGLAQPQAAKRPMSFIDVIEMRTTGDSAPSPDGRRLLYTLTSTDWKAGKKFSDIYLVQIDQGAASTRQMTYTRAKNESSPRWSRDGKFFVFTSNREAPASSETENQLYLMRADGGEAQRITDAKDGVGSFAFSRDGKWLAFSAGKREEQQIWVLPVASIETEKPQALTRHSSAVSSWKFSPDSRRIYFLAPDADDKDNRLRKEKKFDVRIRNEESAQNHLWSIDLESRQEKQLSSGTEYSVSDVTVSKDSKWIGFRGTPNNRYMRTVTETNIYGDLYLLAVQNGDIERLTNNVDIGESVVHFSLDSNWIAFSASDNFTYFRNARVYLRRASDKAAAWKKLGDGFDGDVSVGFWSDDARTIYFNEGIGAASQAFSLSTDSGRVTQLTREKAALSLSRDEDSGTLLLQYSDSENPTNYFVAPSIDRVADRKSWRQLTDSNPQVRQIALGETEAIQWKSTDGKMVEGVLVKPVGYEPGKRYPLVVQIHGGPAGVVTLSFNASSGYYSHVYAGAGYVCLLPNYRGSVNYGEKFKMQISRDYFRQGYDDIMAGVDHLITTGLVDADKMGVMGWSAGGHWSNWILTHTNRFKAISSGAGAVNWISMYAQSDIQRNREFYYGGAPYDNFEHYWDVSPLKYIKNARTPTLIHVVDGDPRVPRPQSEELHMALRKLNVPTELFVYPGNTHGITEVRNQMVKMVSEFQWFEKWIRGRTDWFQWKDLLQTLEEEKPASRESPVASRQ
ncbi:MAG: S9 family peptidase [Acidobacteriota bacterium]